jgi:hypothetical protein
MRIISHRGNVNGRLIEVENSPDHIENALNSGFDVEVDLWLISDQFYLGHDNWQYPIDLDWLESRSDFLWIHCKNEECLLRLGSTNLNYFWHESDRFTITSKNYIWTYVGLQIPNTVINLRDEDETINRTDFIGICTDYPLLYVNKNTE